MSQGVYGYLLQQLTHRANDWVQKAHDVWSEQAPVLHPEHSSYVAQSDAFLEWCACEWGYGAGQGLFSLLLQNDMTFPSAHAYALAWLHSHRSLFRIARLSENILWLEDLWGEALFEVRERRSLVALEPGNVFEGRVVPTPERPGTLFLGKTFLLHPPTAFEHIVALRPRIRSQGVKQAWLWHLQRLRLRSMDYQHVPVQHIYASPLADWEPNNSSLHNSHLSEVL